MILEDRGDKNATDILYKHSNIVTRHTCLCQIKLHPNGGFIYIAANNHATRTVNKRILRRVRVLPNHNSACAQKAKREKKIRLSTNRVIRAAALRQRINQYNTYRNVGSRIGKQIKRMIRTIQFRIL